MLPRVGIGPGRGPGEGISRGAASGGGEGRKEPCPLQLLWIEVLERDLALRC